MFQQYKVYVVWLSGNDCARGLPPKLFGIAKSHNTQSSVLLLVVLFASVFDDSRLTHPFHVHLHPLDYCEAFLSLSVSQALLSNPSRLVICLASLVRVPIRTILRDFRYLQASRFVVPCTRYRFGSEVTNGDSLSIGLDRLRQYSFCWRGSLVRLWPLYFVVLF